MSDDRSFSSDAPSEAPAALTPSTEFDVLKAHYIELIDALRSRLEAVETHLAKQTGFAPKVED